MFVCPHPEVAYDLLNLSQLTINLKKEDGDPEKIQSNEYFYAGGLVEYVKWLNIDKVCLPFFLCLLHGALLFLAF